MSSSQNARLLAPFVLIMIMTEGLGASGFTADYPSWKLLDADSGSAFRVWWAADGQSFFYLRPVPNDPQSVELVQFVVSGQKTAVALTASALARAVQDPKTLQFCNCSGSMVVHPDSDGKSLILQAERSLVRINLEDQAKETYPTIEHLDAADIQVSLNRKWLTYSRNSTLWVRPLNGTISRPIVPPSQDVYAGVLEPFYREGFDLQYARTWSPTESYLAFLKLDMSKVESLAILDGGNGFQTARSIKYVPYGRRIPTVQLGIYKPSEAATEWIPLPVSWAQYIPRFGWLPDSDVLYFVVVNRTQTRIALCLYDPAVKHASVIVEESSNDWVQIPTSVHFLAGRAGVVWESNRDGYHHLYLYTLAGSPVRQLTTGPWNISKFVGVSKDGREALFTAFKDSPLEESLYRVASEGGPPERLTTEHGVRQWIDMSPSNNFYLDYVSSFSTPTQVFLGSINAPGETKVYGEALKSSELIIAPTRVEIPMGREKTLVSAFLFVPHQSLPTNKFPAIVVAYGAPGGQIVEDQWSIVNLLLYQTWVQEGFVVLITDNRLARYFSHRSQASVHGHPGPIEADDLVSAVQWLRNNPLVDSDRIGLWGASYGGFSVLYTLSHREPLWCSAEVFAPVTDWTKYDAVYSERLLGLTGVDVDSDQSIMSAAKSIRTPLFVFHGLNDENVPVQHSLSLVTALIEEQKKVWFYFYPNIGHNLPDWQTAEDVSLRSVDFWKRTLTLGCSANPSNEMSSQ